MKIAFTAQGTDLNAQIDPRFGRTQYLVVYDEETGEVKAVANDALYEAHGAGPKMASKVGDLGAQVLITGNGPGGNAASVLSSMGVTVYVGASGTLKEAYEAYKAGKLQKQ